MEENEIKQILIERGYEEKAAEVVAHDLYAVQNDMKVCRDTWLQSGEELDFESHGFSIFGLMRRFGLKYPAALLSIDWVIRQPDLATKSINRGIK